MSCESCHQYQESDVTSFYRWKNANIEVRGCNLHVGEVYTALRSHPDLLEACKATIIAISERRHEPRGYVPEYLRNAVALLRSAIAKAGGQS